MDDHIPQARSRRDVNLQVPADLLALLAEQALVGADPGFPLGLARLWRHVDPFQLALEGLLALGLALLLAGQPLLLLLQPGGVVALPGDAVAAVQLQDPAGDVIQEIPVVGHGDDRPGVIFQVLFQPGNRLCVQVVGRLVEQQDIGLFEQQAAQGDAPALAPGEDRHRGIAGWAAQGVHGELQAAVQVPGAHRIELILELGLLVDERVHLRRGEGFAELQVQLVKAAQGFHRLLDPFLDHLAHRPGGVECGFLFEVAHAVSRGKGGLPQVVLVDPRHNTEQAALSGPVQSQDADLRPIKERKRDIPEDLLVGRVDLAYPDHRINDLVGHIDSCTRFD